MEARKPNVLLQYGLISGLVSILFLVILYLGGTKLFTNPIAFLGYALPIVFAVLACVKQKKLNGGYLEFKEALKISFGVLVISSLAATLLTYVLFNFIDTAFRESMVQVSIEMTQKFMQKFNAPQDAIDKAVQELTTSNPYALGKLIFQFVLACILWFIFALIISAIVKKKRPEFPEATV